MNDLRALTLTQCHNLPFILTLNPRNNPSNLVICPKLEELVLYAEERTSRGTKLPSITIVDFGELVLGRRCSNSGSMSHVWITGLMVCDPTGILEHTRWNCQVYVYCLADWK
jgi:hypothetical protein